MNRTKIEWTQDGYTWNPLKMRCTKASDGCRNCWHMAMARRHAANPTFPNAWRDAYAGGVPVLDEKELLAPLAIKKPAKIAVQLMGDLFHEIVTDDHIDQIFAVMALTPRHTFQVLTKRPRRMLDYFQTDPYQRILTATNEFDGKRDRPSREHGISDPNVVPWKNVWLGVSVENQATADERIPLLLQTPAAVRWVSYEPALESVDFGHYLRCGYCDKGEDHGLLMPEGYRVHHMGLSWVVCGGESGPGARPFHIDWARSIRDQCRDAGIPIFIKQMGSNSKVHINEPIEEILARSGGDMAEWPADLRVRQFPGVIK